MEILVCSINYDFCLLIRFFITHKSTYELRVLHFFGLTAYSKKCVFSFRKSLCDFLYRVIVHDFN